MVDYLEGILVPIVMGSDSDLFWAEKIKEALDAYKIKSQYRIASAHRSPDHVLKIIGEYNSSVDKILIVSIAGGTDALSGMLAVQSKWPVVSCPPEESALYESCLKNPPGTSNAVIPRPENVARFAAQYFGGYKEELHTIVLEQIKEKEEKIISADRGISD